MGRANRILALVVAIAIIGASVYLVTSRFSPEESVTVATYRQPGSLPVWVAYEMGFFAERGVAVRLVEFSGGGLSAHVLSTGGADIAGLPTVLALQLAEAGTPLRLVHATQDARPGTSQLLVRADLEADALEDLQDRTVGFEALEASCLPCTAFQRVIESAGVTVVRVAVPDYKIEEAFANRIVDAAVVSQPFATFAVDKGLAYPLVDGRLGPSGDAAVAAYGVVPPEGGDPIWMGAAGYWTTASFLQARPDAVRRVAAAIADGAAWLRNPEHQASARSILTKYAGGLGAPEFFEAATAAVLETTEYRSYPTGYRDWAGMQRQADVYAALGLLDAPLDVRPLVSTPWFRA